MAVGFRHLSGIFFSGNSPQIPSLSLSLSDFDVATDKIKRRPANRPLSSVDRAPSDETFASSQYRKVFSRPRCAPWLRPPMQTTRIRIISEN